MKASSAKSRRIVLSRKKGSEKQITITPGAKERSLSLLAKEGVEASVLLDLRKVRAHSLTVTLERGADVSLQVLSGSRAGGELKQSCTVASRSRFRWQNLTEGNVRQSLSIYVTGAQGHADILWTAHAKRNEIQELYSHVLFSAPHGSGETTIRAVAEERATIALRGIIEISRKGKGTETRLTEKVLLLDPTAKVDAVPKLKIETNDVKAGHSATISKISPEDLFYLASRGIPEREARKMYVEGFLGRVPS